MKYYCTNDRYNQDYSEYDSIEEFLDMCQEVFGEKPTLTEKIDGGHSVWMDEQGEIVLQMLLIH